MRHRLLARRAIATSAAILVTAGALMSATPSYAADQPDPVGNLVKKVTEPVKPVTDTVKKTVEQVTGTPRTSSPSAPTLPSTKSGSAKGEAVHGKVGGQSVAKVGGSEASTDRDGRARSTSSSVTVLGQDVTRSEADSRGTTQQGFFLDALTGALCEGSGGALCASVLDAQSSASESGGSSAAKGSSSVAKLCVGGDDETGESCGGPIRLGAGESTSYVVTQGGRTQAYSTAELASVCLVVDAAGDCALDVAALSSQGSSDSGTGTATRSSEVAGLRSGAQELFVLDQPTVLAVLDAACNDSTLACVLLDQGVTTNGREPSHLERALDLSVLPVADLVSLQASMTETAARPGGQQVFTPGKPSASPTTSKGKGQAAGDAQAAGAPSAGGLLPGTGGPSALLLGAGVALMGGGAAVALRRRGRREQVDVRRAAPAQSPGAARAARRG